MQLAVHENDADILLKQKNVLSESVLDKYRVAGQIAQTVMSYVISLINDSYHLGKTEKPYSCQECCALGDSMSIKLLSRVYNHDVREKGISIPVTIELNEIASGFSPELDDDSKFFFSQGDIVTITLGVHIDGYTSNISHTMVIYPPGVAVNNTLKPSGPLLGSKADAICAAQLAVEAVVSLIGLALTPEKVPEELKTGNSISGRSIRLVVDSIAESFNCTVVPGSKVRRIRRFLAGQAEGIVAEKDFKGVVWDESHQEEILLRKSNQVKNRELILNDNDSSKPITTSNTSAVPSDDFSIVPGEVYQVDIKMSPVSDFKEVGLVTLEEIDHFTGKNEKNGFNSRPTIYIRDLAESHQLKLKTARKLLGYVDKHFSVYPFKLCYTSPSFPIDLSKNIDEQIQNLRKELKSNRLGLAELSNRHLIKPRPIQIAKFISLEKILKSANTTGKLGIDPNKPVLPGMELPLPHLNISSLKLRSLMKFATNVPVARELVCVVVNNLNNDLIRLTGGPKSAKPSWVHSNYSLRGNYAGAINALFQLAADHRFGIAIKTCNPYKLLLTSTNAENMVLD